MSIGEGLATNNCGVTESASGAIPIDLIRLRGLYVSFVDIAPVSVTDMKLKLPRTLSVCAVIAYLLGWVKASEYWRTFGLGLAVFDFTLQDYLFESVYVVVYLVFFLATWFVVVSSSFGPIKWRVAVSLVGFAYALLPFTTNHALRHIDWTTAAWLTEHYYMVLKFTPFVLLYLVWLVNPEFRRRIGGTGSIVWPYGKFFLVVYLTFVLAWGISMARHNGSIEAYQVQVRPGNYLPRVRFHVPDRNPELKPLEAGQNLYLLYANPNRYFVWDTTGFSFTRPGQQVNVLIIPRDKVEWVETWSEVQVRPGSVFF